MSRFNTISTPHEYESQIANSNTQLAGLVGPLTNPFAIGPSYFDTIQPGEDVLHDSGFALPDETGEMAVEDTPEIAIAEAAEGSIMDTLDPVSGIATGLGLIGSTLEDSDAKSTAQGNYFNAMNTGHGMGFSQLAQQNLSNATNGIGTHQALTLGLTSALGPFGSFLSTLVPPSLFTPQTSDYEVNTTGGNSINAQDPSNANTSSDVTGDTNSPFPT